MAVRHCWGWELHVGRHFQDTAEEVNWLFQFTCSGTCTSGLHKETPRLHGLANSLKEMLSSVTAAYAWAGQAITALIFSLLLSQQLEKTYKLSSCFWFYGL